MINKILFITLSNIGDVILTLPTLDLLRQAYPKAKVTVMVGSRPKEIFEDAPYIDKIIVYNKQLGLKENIRLFWDLMRERFDMVVDLRNSFFGAILPVRYKVPIFLDIHSGIKHMNKRHLRRLPKIVKSCQRLPEVRDIKSLWIAQRDRDCIEDILKQQGINKEDKIIVISSGARSHIKRWDKDKYLELIESLIKEFKVKVILVGDKEDVAINKYIADNSASVIDLTGRTSLLELAYLLTKAILLVTNDSAILHMASYLNMPIVAIFGPTDEEKYGPWSENFRVVKKDIFCRPCQEAQCRFGNLSCMQFIKVEDVLRAIREVIILKAQGPRPQAEEFKRILIVRTDRIGDVLLSTPVIRALRDEYPHAYIAMMVNPYAKEIVEANPYLDEVIIYDKDGKHKSWRRSMKFALNLRKKRFDLAIILHPTNRMHLVTFFAGIGKRIGYDRKFSFLLTDKIKHTKQLGQRHELEYNLDLVRHLGIEPKDKSIFMPIKKESQGWLRDLFKQEGIKENDKLLAIHPCASCPSKIWPIERFAQVADRLQEKYGFKILIIAGPKDINRAEKVLSSMRHCAFNLAGRTSISQLASLLKRCQLFISNDSGPVHIASAVGTPVVSIFGRNQRGLSPLRWGPVGRKDKVLHKEVGCIECLAHNCIKEFSCLKAITVEDVLDAVDSVLKS